MTLDAIRLNHRPFPRRTLQALVFSIAMIALAMVVPFVVTKHHAETIRYCDGHRGARSIWLGNFGSGAVVLCADGTTDPYYGKTRIVDDTTQPSYVADVKRVAPWVLAVSALAFAVVGGLLIRWHWTR